MAQEEQALLASIYDTLQSATQAERDVEHLQLITRSVVASEPDEELDDARFRLKTYAEKMFLQLRILAERLGLPDTREEIVDFQKKHPDLAHCDISHGDCDIYAPALVRAREYLGCLESLVNPEQSSQLNVFRTILQHTAKIIADAELSPAKEAKVRNQILRVTSYSFTDAAKEIDISQSVKSYRADIAIPSIKAVAEYKFAKSEGEMKNCLDGIYADMKGYSGHSEWQHFFAVFYMKEAFFTQNHIEKEFQRVGASSNWTPIVINGPTAEK